MIAYFDRSKKSEFKVLTLCDVLRYVKENRYQIIMAYAENTGIMHSGNFT